MRKACRRCGYHWFWHLGDGRYKCRQCGQRQSFRSVWESSRLAEAHKRRLLEYFVLGVPAQRLQFRGPVSPQVSARFFRLIRQVLACHTNCPQPFSLVTVAPPYSKPKNAIKHGQSPLAASKVVVFGLCYDNAQLQLLAVDDNHLQLLQPVYQPQKTIGQLWYVGVNRAYVALEVRGKRVIVSTNNKNPSFSDFYGETEAIESFWNYAQQWLAARPELPLKFLHLYLAETLYRFNHLNQDIFPLLYKALKGTDISQVQP